MLTNVGIKSNDLLNKKKKLVYLFIKSMKFLFLQL